MTKEQIRAADSQPRQLLNFIEDKFLTSHFLELVHNFRGRLYTDLVDLGIRADKIIIDNLPFIELITYAERIWSIDFIHFSVAHPNRFIAFDNLLVGQIILTELQWLEENKPRSPFSTKALSDKSSLNDFRDALLKSYRVVNDPRKIFQACYINSMLKQHPLKFKSAIDSACTSISINQIMSPRLTDLCDDALILLSAAIIMNAHLHTCAETEEEKKFARKDLRAVASPFYFEPINNLLTFDFLNGDLSELCSHLESGLTWLSDKPLTSRDKDKLLSALPMQMAAIHFAYHQDSDKLRVFIDAIMQPMNDYLELSPKDLNAVKSMMVKQAMLIDPLSFIQEGFTLRDVLDPLTGCSDKVRASFKESRGIYNRCDQKDNFWLSDAVFTQIIHQGNFKISAQDILTHVSNTAFSYEMLNAIHPEGYREYFIDAMDDISLQQLHVSANALRDHADDKVSKTEVELAYLSKVIKRTGDDQIDPKKYALPWTDKSALIESLRANELLGKLSTVKLLGLTGDDFRHDMSLLSPVAKRYLLSRDLEI